MPTQFTSYWGSSIHGVEILWKNDILDPNRGTGDPVELEFEYTCNLYWRMPYWFDDGASANGPDSELGKTLGTSRGVNINSTGITYAD